MRYPAEQKAETRKKIINAAARSFREHGSVGEGVARLMQDVGLTHGGFYRHFESKEDLYVDAIAKGFQQAADGMIAAVASAPPRGKKRPLHSQCTPAGRHLHARGGGVHFSHPP